METGHDIVVVGASAGGVEALLTLAAGLPADLAAAVFIVLHVSPHSFMALPDLLNRHGPLRASLALHGETITPGRIYVAPPDNHLMLRPGYLHVVRGPKENGHRPSVDALFRTASKAYGPRVIGVVLTGYLDCGTAGLISIKARNGLAVVQSPDDAEVTNMPNSAIRHVAVDHIAPVREIPRLIARLVREPAAAWPPHLPGALAEVEGDELGVPSPIACPLCQGSITTSTLNGFELLRCHIGHSFSRESMVAEQSEEVERALWAACRALEESATLAQKLTLSSSEEIRQRFAEKAAVQARQAQLIRQIMDGRGLTGADIPAVKAGAGEPNK